MEFVDRDTHPVRCVGPSLCWCAFPLFFYVVTTRSCHFGEPWHWSSESELPIQRRGGRNARVCRSGQSSFLWASKWCMMAHWKFLPLLHQHSQEFIHASLRITVNLGCLQLKIRSCVGVCPSSELLAAERWILLSAPSPIIVCSSAPAGGVVFPQDRGATGPLLLGIHGGLAEPRPSGLGSEGGAFEKGDCGRGVNDAAGVWNWMFFIFQVIGTE